MVTKKLWTANEDKYFLKTVIDIVGGKSGTLNDAFEVVSKKLGRSVPGCQARYKNTIKNEMPQNVLDIISLNNPRNAALKSQSQGGEENTSIIPFDINKEDIEGGVIEDEVIQGEFFEDEGIRDEVIEANEIEEVLEVNPEDDFSDVPSLIAELITLDNRRKTIKERIKKYHEFIGGVLSNK